jgi:hypothetical protein
MERPPVDAPSTGLEHIPCGLACGGRCPAPADPVRPTPAKTPLRVDRRPVALGIWSADRREICLSRRLVSTIRGMLRECSSRWPGGG